MIEYTRRLIAFLGWAALAAVLSISGSRVAAETTSEAPLATTEDHVSRLRPLFAVHCLDCHSGEEAEAGLDIEGLLDLHPLVREREAWQRVIQLIRLEAMPPEEAEQPTTAEREELLGALDLAITRFDYSGIDDPGFEPVRRLTHSQFDNTIRDLFGVDLKPARRFPSELTGESGFDNSANTLFLQAPLMERYIGIAEGIVNDALSADADSDQLRKTKELIFIARPDEGLSDEEAAEMVLRRFLLRAYRRPPTAQEVELHMARYRGEREDAANFDDAIRTTLPAVLIAPSFLLRIEQGNETSAAYRVNDWELASRLSYFLWASMPDDELLELAASGTLHEDSILADQVRRMLADPKADAFGETFASQWLNTRLVGTRIRLDPIDVPWCTDSLMAAMRTETAMFFTSLLRENRQIRELIDANYTFVNEELATTLYEMDDVTGTEMRRVELSDPNRGGILTHPSVLTVTSSYRRTSPIKRGVYVLETVLGTPPPPPPPDAGELNPKLRRNRRLTFREKLSQHSSDKTCRSCHALIDPMGFALEHFDFFGRWRDTYRRRKEIDASAELTDGTRFDGAEGLKQILVEHRHDELVRQMTMRLLSYGLGRQLEYFDEPAIEKIIEELAANEFRFQTLLQAIVKSYPFQYRKNPSDGAAL